MPHLDIQISNLKLQLEFAQLRLGSAKIRIEEYADSILSDVINDTILESCRTVAKAAGMNQGYVDAIKFEKSGFLFGDVVNDYSTPSKDALHVGVPLAVFFENGTSTHFISPLSPGKVLVWEDKAGTIRYSKGHMVNGIKAMKIMANGVKFGLERFKNQMIQKINSFLQEGTIQ